MIKHSTLSRLSRNFINCLFGKLALKSFNFITLPLLTCYLAYEEMGVFYLLTGGVGIFKELMALGTRQDFDVQFFRSHYHRSRLNLIGQNIWVYFIFSSILSLTLFGFFKWNINSNYLVICSIFVFRNYLSLFNELYLRILCCQELFTRHNLICIFFGAVQIIFVIFTVAYLKLGLFGLIISLFLSELLQILYTFSVNKRTLNMIKDLLRKRKSRKWNNIFPLIRRAYVFIPSILSFWLLMNIDQWMLGFLMGVDRVGIYGLAVKLALLFDFFVSSTFFMIYRPHIYDEFRKDFVTSSHKNFILSIGILCISFVGLLIFSRYVQILRFVIGPHYQASLPLIPLLVFSACLRLTTQLLQFGLVFKHATHLTIWANLFAVLVNICLNSFWIPLYGMNGCLYATVSSFILMLIITSIQYLIVIKDHVNQFTKTNQSTN